MDAVTNINNPIGNNQNLLESTNEESLGKDDFLRLLITQLQNQDPLNPNDPSEFVAQLAQFSSLEQLISVNDNLRIIQNYQSSLESSLATNYFGKSIIASGSAIDHEKGESSDINFSLPEDASEVKVNLYDQAGNFIVAIEKADLSAGEHIFEWDGKDSNENILPTGVYLFEVQAIDYEQNRIDATSYIEGIVTGAKYNYGKIYLTLGEQIVPLSAVIEVIEEPGEEEVENIDEMFGHVENIGDIPE